ncbi:hypothetical protein M8C21_016130, partial [Ambrosia artemisiifolia]
NEKGEKADLEKFVHHVHGNHFIPNTVLVDCTSSTEVADHYHDWLHTGIHVITPNKKANSGPLDKYLKLRARQRQSFTHYFYEATVGAGLPIMHTLRDLLQTGDKIIKIEGIFSGTLSYIFNSFVDTRSFSEVVMEAKAAGYTEPDPRDDLSGTDVARKVIILARECGLNLELSDIPVQSLVPDPLKETASVDDFIQQLPSFDSDIATKRKAAEDAGEVLRYVGVVDVKNQKGVVELQRYNKQHPFAQLSGSDNIIAFTTERYNKQPLIVRGPGAGAEVTAGGVFSDLLRLASNLGKRNSLLRIDPSRSSSLILIIYLAVADLLPQPLTILISCRYAPASSEFKRRLQQLPDSDNISIAFPDDGAWKRFHKQLQHFPMTSIILARFVGMNCGQMIMNMKVGSSGKRRLKKKEKELQMQFVEVNIWCFMCS